MQSYLFHCFLNLTKDLGFVLVNCYLREPRVPTQFLEVTDTEDRVPCRSKGRAPVRFPHADPAEAGSGGLVGRRPHRRDTEINEAHAEPPEAGGTLVEC